MRFRFIVMVEYGYITKERTPQLFYSLLFRLCEEMNTLKEVGFDHDYYRNLKVHDLLWAMACSESQVS